MRVVLHENSSQAYPNSDCFLTSFVKREDGTYWVNTGPLDNAVVFNWCGISICGGQIPHDVADKIARDFSVVPVSIKLLS